MLHLDSLIHIQDFWEHSHITLSLQIFTDVRGVVFMELLLLVTKKYGTGTWPGWKRADFCLLRRYFAQVINTHIYSEGFRPMDVTFENFPLNTLMLNN